MSTSIISFSVGPEAAAKAGAEFWQKWQDTVSDAVSTWREAAAAPGPMAALSTQLDFNRRNVQRWWGWHPVMLPGACAPAGKDLSPAALPEIADASGQALVTIDAEPNDVASAEPAAAPVASAEPAAAPAAPPAQQPEPDDPQQIKGISPADDLKRIKGIGPAIERKLHEHGITTFEQLAGLDEGEIDRLEEAFLDFPGRIERDGWVAQAAKLAARD